MIFIFLCVCALFLVASSAGCAFFSLLRHRPQNPFLTFFAGVFFLGLAGMAASIFVPLNALYSLVCFIPALFGILQLRRMFRHEGQRYRALPMSAFFVAIAGVCALGAAYQVWPGIAYDTDLYHIQIVRWLNEYGTPFGLGNLHSRLANSSLWPILSALFNHGIIKDRIPWVIMPTFITAFTMYFIYNFLNRSENFLKVYALCMFPVCIYSILNSDYPNLYYDFPALAVLCIAGSELLSLLYTKRNTVYDDAISLFMCITLSFLIKPLSIVTVLFLTPIILYYLYTAHGLTRGLCAKLLIPSFIASILWCTRNVITSGYPFFPITLLPFNVDWIMPSASVTANAQAVRGWARMPGPHCLEALTSGISYWLVPWAKSLFSAKQALTILAPLAAGSLCWFFLRKQLLSLKALCVFCWPVLSIVYWFWMAPDPRFGREYFWLFFALGAACCVLYKPTTFPFVSERIFNFTKKQYIFPSISVIFIMFMCSTASLYTRLHGNEISWIMPERMQPLPTKFLTAQSGDASLDVYVPINDDRCGNAPLPCAPAIPHDIVLRDKNTLRAGFRFKP